MVISSFEHEGNNGLLKIITYFNREVELECIKNNDEIFRLGGTAINDVMVYEGVILELSSSTQSRFKAFKTSIHTFEDIGIKSQEDWTSADLHCYITEYYPLDMEGKPPGWFISKKPILNANQIFVNLDFVDGGGNLIRRYRVSTFTGEHREIYA